MINRLLLLAFFFFCTGSLFAAEYNKNVYLASYTATSKDPETQSPTVDYNTHFEMTYFVKNGYDVYTKGQDNFYNVTESYCEYEATSILNGVADPTEEGIDTDIPDSLKGEHTRAKILKKGNSDYSILVEVRFITDSNRYIDISGEFELELLQGSWKEFENGETIVFKYSPNGLDEMEKVFSEILVKQFEADMIQNLKMSGIEMPKVRSKLIIKEIPNSSIELNKDTIRETSKGPFDITVIVDMYIPQES